MSHTNYQIIYIERDDDALLWIFFAIVVSAFLVMIVRAYVNACVYKALRDKEED